MDKLDLVIKLIEDAKAATNKRLGLIDKRLDKYNEQLELHIEGVTQNRTAAGANKAVLDIVVADVEELKVPQKFISNVKSVTMAIAKYISVIGGAIWITLKLTGKS